MPSLRRAPALARPVPAAALALALLAACAARQGAGTAARPEPRRLELPGRPGALVVPLPAGWELEERQEEGVPLALELSPPAGDVVITLQVFWNPRAPGGEVSIDFVQGTVERGRREIGAKSVEAEIPLGELRGPEVHGFWFFSTDRELVGKTPPAGEYHHLVQGAVAVRSVVVAFSLLDQADGPHRAAFLDLVRGLRLADGAAEDGSAGGGPAAPGEGPGAKGPGGGATPGPSAAPGAGPSTSLGAGPSAEMAPFSVALDGRDWSVLVDLPGFRALGTRGEDAAEAVHALAEAPDRGIVASVIVRAARSPGGAAECRAADLARIRASVPGVAGERTAERPPLALASFTAPPVRGEGIVRHALAWLRHRDGCVQVHLSAPDGPEVEAALAAILDSARIAQDF